MKNWWRKWSYEIPLAFGDALWEVLVVQFADFLSRLTVRRVLELLCRTHDVICVDTGNNVESPNWQTVLQASDQLVVTTKSPCCARKSCATSVIAALLPPWLVTITSLLTPERATLSPNAIQLFSAVSVGSVSVPG